MKIYTKKGDDGSTSLLFGGRVQKDDVRTEAYGCADKACSALGVARALGLRTPGLESLVIEIQRQLFVVGAQLATSADNWSKLQPGVSKVTNEMVAAVEAKIDEMVKKCPLPANFVLPGGTAGAAALDLARCEVREAERRVVTMSQAGLLPEPIPLVFLNRLSDLLFVAARSEESAVGASSLSSR